MGRKHCGKRRNCSLRVISSFPALFSKDFYCRHVKTRACFGNRLRAYSNLISDITSAWTKLRGFPCNKCNGKVGISFGIGRKYMYFWKRRECWFSALFSFSHNVFKRRTFSQDRSKSDCIVVHV